MAAQLRAVSQTLRDSQQRCHWLEGRLQLQSHAHSQVNPVHAPERLAKDDTYTRDTSVSAFLSPPGGSVHRSGSRSPSGEKRQRHRCGKHGRRSAQGTVRDMTAQQEETFFLVFTVSDSVCVCVCVCIQVAGGRAKTGGGAAEERVGRGGATSPRGRCEQVILALT